MTRIVICGGPRTGKTTLADAECIAAARRGGSALWHTDDLIGEFSWSSASLYISEEWLTRPGPWIIEGVAVSRALRKWREAHPGDAPPVDKVIRLTTPHVALTRGQAAMAKGEETVWQEIADWLFAAGIPLVEQAELRCEHPGHNGTAEL